MTSPLVSFVIIGRNDGYMGDYLYRLGTSLSFLAQSAARAGLLDEVEVLVVDWGSDRPLSRDLELLPDARRITRFLEVTPAMGSGRWHPTCAVNVGVRRARGTYVLFTDSDCLWTESAMETLGRLLRGGITLPVPIADVYCYVRRYQVPWSTVHRKPGLDEWRRLAALLVAGVQAENPAATLLGGFSAGQLMHRRLWIEARGYDESLDRPWGWSDNDLVLRVTQRHTWLDVSSYGFFGLHMEHWPHEAAKAARDQSTINPMTIRNTPVTNGPEWGLGDQEIPPTAGTCDRELPSGFGCAVPLTGQTASPVWQPGPEARDFVARRHVRAEPGTPLAQLEAVAQVGLADRPRNLYWFGPISPPVLQTLIGTSPGTELILANPWPEGASRGDSFHPGQLAGALHGWGFKGWARLLQGAPDTALERLRASDIGTSAVELAWIDPETPARILRELAQRLAPGGVVFSPVTDDGTAARDRVREAMPGCAVRVLGEAKLLVATRPLEMRREDNMHVDTTSTPTPTPTPPTDTERSLRVVLDMLLRDKARGLVEADALPWDRPLLVLRSAHMGRMEAFFNQVVARQPNPVVHVMSHARDEAALRAIAACDFTFHAYGTPGGYRLEHVSAEQLAQLRAVGFGAVFFLDAGTEGQGLDEAERLLAAILPDRVVGFMGNGRFVQAPDTRQRALAEAAFLGLIEWYHFKLDPA